jgi:hypothetical protein
MVVAPEDDMGLTSALNALAENRAQLAALAEQCRWIDRFERETVLKRFESELNEIGLRNGADPSHGVV